MIVTFFIITFINRSLVNFGLISCLLASVESKQKPFKWLLFWLDSHSSE